jgi:hypothetical protein
MHVKAMLKDYEKLAFSVAISAPVEEWRAMVRQAETLSGGSSIDWPLSGFVACVRKMLADLDKTHTDVLIHED